MSTQTKFHSADFDKTPPTFASTLPDRLVHRGVEKEDTRAAYSVERKHPVHFVDLPSNAVSVTVGGLAPGGRSNRHRHTYETILYVLEGRGYSMIEDRKIEWEPGDALYIPVWAWHHHVNADAEKPARYLACENAPMLQNLGRLAIREEEK
ncbi:cupin domain-containing protein [Methylocapsa palsarum]|uniref:Gentisate 1,2-dioxygenase n=1 Tax=Methylocapsa palsarum TaxID=1612308 RepID=A0A1I3VVP8_9HYPH|nr:cupin domain-containing protein [Methylocapsa palsarum]SFJ99230.1 gentisate 1,2-dioxygenase [Methylocapsa palsarum]